MAKMLTALEMSWTGKWCRHCGCKIYLVWKNMIAVCCCIDKFNQSFLDELHPLDPRD